jgi:hypothetical protein
MYPNKMHIYAKFSLWYAVFQKIHKVQFERGIKELSLVFLKQVEASHWREFKVDCVGLEISKNRIFRVD